MMPAECDPLITIHRPKSLLSAKRILCLVLGVGLGCGPASGAQRQSSDSPQRNSQRQSFDRNAMTLPVLEFLTTFGKESRTFVSRWVQQHTPLLETGQPATRRPRHESWFPGTTSQMSKLPNAGSGQSASNPLLSKTITGVDTLVTLYKAAQGLRYFQIHRFLTDLRRTIGEIALQSTPVSFLAMELTEFARVYSLKKVKPTYLTRMELNLDVTYNRLLTLQKGLRKWPADQPLPTILREGRTGIEYRVPDWRAILTKNRSVRESYDPLDLMRSFLEEPDRSTETGEKLNRWAQAGETSPKKVRSIFSKMVEMLVGPTERALQELERHSGKGFVVKLPLEWTELQSLLNSVSERTLLLFKTARGAYWMVVPGSTFDEGRGAMYVPQAQSDRTFAALYAAAIGHSHPRSTDAEPTENDQASDFDEHFKAVDQFILVLLEQNVLEMSFRNAGQKDYQLLRGHEAIEEVIRRGWVKDVGTSGFRKIPSGAVPARSLAVQA